MSVDKSPCACGAGYFEDTYEMDDWNRSRTSRVIHCPSCQAEHDEKMRRHAEDERQREALLSEAKALAEKRHLEPWLAMYAPLNKKKAWELYTGGSGYPALGTFYQHVKHHGSVRDYMRWCFFNDIAAALQKMDIVDVEISQLLERRTAIRDHREEDRLPM